MATFDMVVDTNPMALGINSVSNDVRLTTGAVVAMQAAVIKEEEEAAKLICHNVDNGFYILIKSQLSQKMAMCSSTMSSKILLMQRFCEEIQHVMHLMQEDYNRILRRYTKQFTSIDKALRSRIRQLDREALSLSEGYQSSIHKQGDDTSFTMCSNMDTQVVNVQSIGAKVKSRVDRELSTIAKTIREQLGYKHKVAKIVNVRDLGEQKAKGVEGTEALGPKEDFVPTLILEAQSIYDEASSVHNVYIAQQEGLYDAKAIEGKIEDTAWQWANMDSESYKCIKDAYTRKVQEGHLEARVAKEMLRLFGDSTIQVPLIQEEL